MYSSQSVPLRSYLDTLGSCVDTCTYIQFVNQPVLFSVTEDEIRVGMLQVLCPSLHCLAYFREFEGITSSVDNLSTSRYIDTKQNKLDVEAQKLLCQLKDKVVSSLSQASVRQMSIPWTGCGVSLNDKIHEEYLHSFCSQVFDDMKKLIDEQIAQKPQSVHASDLYGEVLRQSWFCVTKCKMFSGQEDALHVIQVYLCQSHHQRPFIVHGPSGSGKTSIMAKVAECAKEWLGPGLVTVVRFLGTSPDSATIHSVLRSIIQQICLAFGMSTPSSETLDDFTVLAQYFKTQLLAALPVSPSCPLLLLLDSVDQLSPADGAHNMNWLPKLLPPNVFVAISMLSDGYNGLSVMQSVMPHPECFMAIHPLSTESAGKVLDVWLSSVSRALTCDQRSLVLKTFASFPRPLFLKLLFDQTCHWKYHAPLDKVVLPIDIRDAIAKLLQRLEVHHGSVLVRRALGYITAAKNGLTQAELEDVLSLDDEVLADVYQYWNPPDLKMVRLPQLLWKRIGFEISEYLVERQADGRTVLAWYHRQFIEAAKDRYLSTKEDVKACHSGLVELFSGRWASSGKPLHLHQRNLHVDDAQRGVAAQPLHFSSRIPNVRKMSEYPFHLVRAGLTDELKKCVLCNFEWLYSKLQSTSLAQVIEDFDDYLRLNTSDTMIGLLREALLLSSSNLRSDPHCLAAQLLGRTQTLSQDHPELASLIRGAQSWAQALLKPMLIPQSSCLIAPGGPLRMSLAGHPQRVEQIVLKADEPVAVSVSGGYGDTSLVNVWDLTLGDCLHSFVVSGKKCVRIAVGDSWIAAGSANVEVMHMKTGECMRVIENADRIVCLSASPGGPSYTLLAGLASGVVAAWNVNTGELICQLEGHRDQVTHLSLLAGVHVAVSGSSDSTVRVWDLKSKKVKFCFQYHRGEITCLIVCESPRGVFAVSGSSDMTLRKWCLQTGKCLATMEGHTKTVKDVAILPSGNACISASLDRTVRIWNLNTGHCSKTLKGHEDGVWCVTLTASGSMAVSGSKDDLLKVWDISSGNCIHTLEGHSSWISCVGASQYGKWIVSGSNDKLLKVWDIRRPQTRPEADRHYSQPECIAASSKAFYSGASDGIKVWNLDGHCLHKFHSPTSCLAPSSDGRYVISGGTDTLVKIWDVESVRLLHSIRGHDGGVLSVSVVDNMAFTSSADGTVRVWGLPQGDSIECLHGHSDSVKCIAVSNDAQMVASGSFDRTVRVWFLASGRLQHCVIFEGHNDVIWCIGLTRDKTKAVSGASDRTVRVWDIQSQKCLHVLMHHDNVKALVLTSDSNRLISSDHSNHDQLRLWNLASGDCLLSYRGHNHAVMSIVLVDHDRLALSGSRDGTIKLWDVSGDGQPLASFDAQSQIKYLAHVRSSHASKSRGLVAATTKSGPICILNVRLP